MDDDSGVTPGRAEVSVVGGVVTVQLNNLWRRAYGGSAELLGLDIVSQIAAASTVAPPKGIEAEPSRDPRSLAALASPGFVSRVLTVTDQLLSRPFREAEVREYSSLRRAVVVVTTEARVTGLLIDPAWAKHVAVQTLNETLSKELDRAVSDEMPETVDLAGSMQLQAEAADLIAAAGVW